MRRMTRYFVLTLFRSTGKTYRHLLKNRAVAVVATLLLIILFPLLLLVQHNVFAVSYTWDGGGADNNWSTCANWSTDVCPGAGDTVVFDATSTKNATVDAGFGGAITSININAGYTGIISLGRNLTVSSTFSQAAGTLSNFASTLTTNNFTLSGGTFSVGIGTTAISGAMTISGTPSFNAFSSTVEFNGTTSATLSCNGVTFNLVTFTHTAGTKTVSSDCSLPLGSSPSANAGGSISLDGGTLSGSGTLTTSGTLTMSTAAGGACNGTGGGSASGYDVGHDGGDASGAGCGGGGGGWYGGTGGDGQYGGGGGGAGGGHVAHSGGSGGQGLVAISPDSGSDVVKTSGTSWTVPAGVTSVKVWAVGAGGGGAGVPGSDGTSGGAGGGGGTSYQTFSVTPGDTINFSIGAAGAGGGASTDGSDGGDTTVSATVSAGGEAIDSIASNNGTQVSTVDTTAGGKLNRAGNFGTSSGYLSIPDDEVDLSGDWSVGMWVNPSDTSGTNPRTFAMVDNANAKNLQVGYRQTAMTPYVRINNTVYAISQALSTSTWQHVVYKSSGGTITIYVDGTEYATTTGGAPSANTAYSAIGNGGSASWGTHGLLDDVVLYNRALTTAEVAGRYNSGSGTENLSGSGWDVSDGAVSQWHLNESAGFSTYDIALTGGGGAGGTYNDNTAAAGGSYSGGDGGADGGDGSGASGDTGGGGGGAVGGGSSTEGGHAGDDGGSIADVSGLVAVLNGLGYGATASSALSGFSGLSASDLTVEETYDFSSFSPFTVSNNLDIEGNSTFTAPSGTATVGGILYVALNNGPATFNAGGGTLNVSGGLYLSLLSTDASTFNGDSGTLNVSGDLYVGLLDSASVFNASSGTTNVGGAFNVAGSRVFNAGSGTLNVGGNFSLAAASNFSAGTGTLNFNGASSGTITCNNASFNEVNFTHTAGTKTVGSNCSLPVGAAPTLGSGSGGNTVNNINGSPADGFGSGGGGAGFFGGGGGDGLYGGGGGGAAGYNVANRIGGTGGSGAVVISPDVGSDVVLTTDNSWKVPAGVSSVKVWAIGGGGGGAGATSTNATAGGGGGAGGVVYQTFSVSPDDNITYNVGIGGDGGIDTDDGTGGGDTTVTVGATTITANGGAGGTYNDGATAAGGSYSGGDGGVAGGNGTGATGNTGGGGGGGIGGGAPSEAGTAGDTGGQAIDVSGLFAVVSGLGYATTGPGGGGGSGSGTTYGVTLNGTLSGSGTLTASADLTLNSGGSLSGFGGLSANNLTVNGTYNFGSYSPFTVNSDFAVGATGNFTAPSGTASFYDNFSVNAGSTFSANGGTVNFRGTASASIACGSKTFNLVTFTHSAGTKVVGSDCSLPLGSNPTVGSSTSSLSLSGTLSGSGTLTMGGGNTGTLTLNSGGSLSGFSGLSTKGLTVKGTYGFGSYSPFTVSGNFAVNTGASFTAPSGTATFTKDFTISSGATFGANGGTVRFNGSSATLSCGGKTYSTATFIHTSGTKVVGSDCSLPLGSNPTLGSGGSTSVSGILSGSNTLTSPATLTIASGGSLSGFSGLTANVLAISGTLNAGSYSPFTVSSTFNLNNGGSFTAPSGTATFSSTFTINSGATFSANGGTVRFNGGTATLSCGGKTFNRAVFAQTSGTKTVSSNCSLPLGSNPTLGSGGSTSLSGTLSGSGTLSSPYTLTLNSGGSLSGFSGLSANVLTVNGTYNAGSYSSFTVSGNFTIGVGGSFTAPSGTATFESNFTNSGTFNANGGTVKLTGTSQSLNGDTSFYNLTKTTTSADTLTLGAGDTVSVSGKLTLQGASLANLLSLVSSVPGISWLVNANGTTNVDYVEVTDGSGIGSSIIACNSVDSGGNNGWSFNPASCHPNKNGLASSTGIANYELLQAYLAAKNSQQLAQNSQKHLNLADLTSLSGDGNLPSKLYSFAHHFPAGRGLVKAGKQLLRAGLAGLIFFVLIVAFIILQNRRHKEPKPAEGPPATITPTHINISLPSGKKGSTT